MTVAAVAARVAAAQPVASTESRAEAPAAEPAAAPAPLPLAGPSASEVSGAPLPGDESGRTDEPEHDSYVRRVGRIVLYPEKLLLGLVLDPIRATVWAEDRYHLDELYYKTFYNADRSIGVVPTGTYATGFGFTVGARFVDHDTFGDRELLGAEATTGVPGLDSDYTFHQSVSSALDSGNRLGRVRVGVGGNFDRRPQDPFYGIGNANVVTTLPAQPIDARSDPTAVDTHYRYQEARVAGWFDVRLIDALHVRTTGALADHQFSPASTGPVIDQVYDPAGLVGYGGFSNVYGELELRYDRRHRASEWEPHDLHAEGFLADAAVGRVHELDAGVGPDFWRGTVELQDYWRIARGPRLLALRFRTEAVSGSVDEVPFSELPMLGGGDFLRGYDFERFRDRVAALGSAEYVWDIARWFDAALFVDVGRVYDSLPDITLDHLRVGYGVGLEVNNDNSFLFELSVASSIDGGVFLNLSFNPVFDARPRWR